MKLSFKNTAESNQNLKSQTFKTFNLFEKCFSLVIAKFNYFLQGFILFHFINFLFIFKSDLKLL